jgi:hypothetical protein
VHRSGQHMAGQQCVWLRVAIRARLGDGLGGRGIQASKCAGQVYVAVDAASSSSSIDWPATGSINHCWESMPIGPWMAGVVGVRQVHGMVLHRTDSWHSMPPQGVLGMWAHCGYPLNQRLNGLPDGARQTHAHAWSGIVTVKQDCRSTAMHPSSGCPGYCESVSLRAAC